MHFLAQVGRSGPTDPNERALVLLLGANARTGRGVHECSSDDDRVLGAFTGVM